MFILNARAPERYQDLLQEDRIVEWGTFWLFLAASVLGLRRSIRERRLFDGLVALFCLFVAGEEISWGQRLLGYAPPEVFLANNFQQEANLHNLAQWFLQPKWFLMTMLASYGVLLPLLARAPRWRALMERVGATPPPRELMPWFIAGIALLVTYPLTLTGEWVELLAGSLFLMSVQTSATSRWIALALTVVVGVALTAASDTIDRGRDAPRLACANTEVRSLVDDIASGQAGTPRLWRGRLQKRIWTSGVEGYLQSDSLKRFNTALCSGPAGEGIGLRHKYGVDPWGSPYWLLIEQVGDEDRRVTVYSFGPNRRRDLSASFTAGDDIGDDIVASRVKRAPRTK